MFFVGFFLLLGALWALRGGFAPSPPEASVTMREKLVTLSGALAAVLLTAAAHVWSTLGHLESEDSGLWLLWSLWVFGFFLLKLIIALVWIRSVGMRAGRILGFVGFLCLAAPDLLVAVSCFLASLGVNTYHFIPLTRIFQKSLLIPGCFLIIVGCGALLASSQGLKEKRLFISVNRFGFFEVRSRICLHSS